MSHHWCPTTTSGHYSAFVQFWQKLRGRGWQGQAWPGGGNSREQDKKGRGGSWAFLGDSGDSFPLGPEARFHGLPELCLVEECCAWPAQPAWPRPHLRPRKQQHGAPGAWPDEQTLGLIVDR